MTKMLASGASICVNGMNPMRLIAARRRARDVWFGLPVRRPSRQAPQADKRNCYLRLMAQETFTEFHATALADHLTSRSVGLMLFEDGPNEYPKIGSGTCIKICDRHFIATAAHNLNDVRKFSEVGIGALGNVGKYSGQTPKIIAWGRRGGRKKVDPLDVAWLEIKPGAVDPWCKAWGQRFVTLERISLAPVPVGRHVSIYGVPSREIRVGKIEGQPMLGFVPLPYSGQVLPAPLDQPDTDIFFEYPTEANTEEGRKPLPHAEGLSGCGIWLVNDEDGGVWAPDRAQLVGVEHGWLEYEYLRGNPIRVWLEMVREDIPELASEIDPMLATK
jgi:hypothetical protein